MVRLFHLACDGILQNDVFKDGVRLMRTGILFPSIRTAFVFVLFVALMSVQYACEPSGEKPGQSEKLTIACTMNPASALVQIAAKKEFFRQTGLDVTVRPYEFGKLALDAVVNGNADLATTADTPVMYAILDGKAITAYAVIETSTRNQVIIARKDRAIRQAGDLKGKIIGVTKGTNGDFFTDSVLLFHSIAKDRVSVVNLMPDEMPDAILTGKVDAVSTWNPISAQIMRSLGGNGIIFMGDSVYTESFCLVSMKAYADIRPDAVRKVLRALIMAQAFVIQSPEESVRIVSEFCRMDSAILDEIWNVYSFRVTLDQTLIVNLENQTRWAIKNNLVPGSGMPDYLNFISPQILQSVKPEAVRIIR